MARTYANIDAGIWDDPDFTGLSAGAQRTYFMLITQTDITACGTLPLTLRRWGKTCIDKDLGAWLAELSDARFILLDEDTEELLVRTFVKWDGGHKHAKRVLAVIGNARAIRSPALRQAAADELAKLGVSTGNPEPPDRQSVANREPSDSRRVVVTEVGYESTPESTSQEREPSPTRTDPPSMYCSKHPNGTEQACGPCAGARKAYAGWAQAKTEREVEARRTAAAARAACDLCDEKGVRLHPDTKQPLGRCTHQADHRRTA